MTPQATGHDAPWTIGRLLQWTQQYLTARGVPEARLATEILLAHALDCRKIELYTRFEIVPEPPRIAAFRELVKQAAQRVPVAYLVGRKEFFSLDFEISPAVLVPRPETELLVERAIKLCEERGLDEPHFLDIGTGSGCVAIAILKQLETAQPTRSFEFQVSSFQCFPSSRPSAPSPQPPTPGPQSQVSSPRAMATDVSEAALEVARRNAQRHGVAERIQFVTADRLALPEGAVPSGGFDFIVSNPPYITQAERDALPAEVRDHEPPLALFDGADGLSFYRSFAEAGAALLAPGGSILVEIGYSKGPAVVEIFSSGGRFEHAGAWRDPGGPHDRVMEFRKV